MIATAKCVKNTLTNIIYILGLFDKAIIESGTVYSPWGSKNASNKSENTYLLGKLLGCETRDPKILLKCLRIVDMEVLTEAQLKFFPREVQNTRIDSRRHNYNLTIVFTAKFCLITYL